MPIGANGFVAAFAAGSAFGAFAGRGEEREVYYVEQTCGLASMICWLLFGAIGVPTIAESWSWRVLLYAVLSLTVIRMLPVAISLLGARLDWTTVLFIGWFGPRGLASIVFALLALEDLHGLHGPVEEVTATIWPYCPAQRSAPRTDRTTLRETVCSHPASRSRTGRASGASAASVCEPISKGVLI
jgi:NhaP-type Na+/H+ or K+/H+ antiporter